MADSVNENEDIQNVLKYLVEPALSECTRLLKAVSHIRYGRYSDAAIVLQAFVANWMFRHPELPLVVYPDKASHYNDDRKPTERQVNYAITVAKFVQKRLPSKETRGAYSKFLDDNVPEYRKIVAELLESNLPVVPKASDEDILPEPEKKACCVKCHSGSSLKDKGEVEVDDAPQVVIDEIPF